MTVRGKIVIQIIHTLRVCGPMTRADLSLHIDHDKVVLAAVLSRLHKATPTLGKRVYIRAWVYDAERGKRYPRAVYAVGSQDDCPKPVPSNAENSRRHRASKNKRINSVFALAYAPRGLKLFSPR